MKHQRKFHPSQMKDYDLFSKTYHQLKGPNAIQEMTTPIPIDGNNRVSADSKEKEQISREEPDKVCIKESSWAPIDPARHRLTTPTEHRPTTITVPRLKRPQVPALKRLI